ncbi:MAG: GNAT family N-acetyltransferase [Balneolaceae bacterium]
MYPSLSIKTCTGPAIRPHLQELAALRIEVFREYPYLYDGTTAYEKQYLQRYTTSEKSLVVLVMDQDEVVGASTGLPLADEMDAIREPMRLAGYRPETVFYCGESVLKKSYRGKGVYPVLFKEREAHAAAHGLTVCCFCAVDRPDDHPMKPKNYQTLDDVWQRYGYIKHTHLKARLSWNDIGEDEETEKALSFWIKHLNT